jgi:hypothetical protein
MELMVVPANPLILVIQAESYSYALLLPFLGKANEKPDKNRYKHPRRSSWNTTIAIAAC